jgi:hypothetical protein
VPWLSLKWLFLRKRRRQRRCGLTLQIHRPETSPLWFLDLVYLMSLQFDCLWGLTLQICLPETSPLWVDLRIRCLCGLTRVEMLLFCSSTLQIHRKETSPLQFNLADSISLWCNYDLHFELPLWRHVLFLPQSLLLCVSPISVTIMNFCVTPFYAIMIFCIISTDLRDMHCFRLCVRIECTG